MKKIVSLHAIKRNSLFPLVAACLLFLQSCDKPFSIAMHDPISPNPGDGITYSLEMQSGTAPKSVRLYEQVTLLVPATIDLPIIGPIIIITRNPQPEVLLNTWTSPALGTLSFARRGGIPAQCLVTYRFEVTQSDNNIARHSVSYASRDYPSANDPIPVYVVGDQQNTYDVVFIPDSDIGNLDDFRINVRKDIRDAYFDEQTTKLYRHSFNFYINRQTGHATDYDRRATDGLHQLPSNNSYLSFAEGRALLHQADLRDYASGGLFSTEMQNRGTIMHESGHSLFGLADEYQGGAHWQDAQLPNNWSSLTGAQTDAPGRGKTSGDAVMIGTDPWWRLCSGNCQMSNTGLTHVSYDRPCQDRVNYDILEIAMK
ncbi:MAG: hypothetical protein WDO19_15065 [Bacteroidota bacterium]